MQTDGLLSCVQVLPDSIADLTDLLGYHATARLIDAVGGVTISRATRPLLAQALTEDETGKLLSWLGASSLYIPRCDSALRAGRNQRFLQAVREAQREGQSIRQALATLCPQFGFSDRYGWQLLARASEKTCTPSATPRQQPALL